MWREIYATIKAACVVAGITPVMWLKDKLGIEQGIYGGWPMIKQIYSLIYRTTVPEDKTGERLADSLTMIDFKSKKTISLVEFCKRAGKPVVLNFGSCT